MKKLVPVFLIVLWSCQQPKKSSPPFSQSYVLQVNDSSKSIIHDTLPILPIKKIDTAYKDFSSRIAYNEFVSFGMSVSDWNKNISLETQSGKYDRVEESEPGYYKAFKSLGSGTSFWIKGVFMNQVFFNDSLITTIVRINKKIQVSPILTGVEIIYETPSFDITNTFISDLIDSRNYKFVAGVIPPQFTDNTASLSAYIQQDLFNFNKEKLANKKENKSYSSTFQSLYENDELYLIIDITQTSYNEVTRDSKGEIISKDKGRSQFTNDVKICSKPFNELDIDNYRTGLQKEESKSNDKSKSLIEKALREQ